MTAATARRREADLRVPEVGTLAKLSHIAFEDDPSGIDDRDVAADVADEIELMAAEQHRWPRANSVEEDLLHVLDGHRIEARERFVEDQQVGLVHERDRQLHALLVAARQCLHLVVGAVVDVDAFHPRLPPAGLRRPP